MTALERETTAGVLRDAEGVWLVPAPRGSAPGALRVVGPGRRERGLRRELADARAELEARRAELGAAALVERGTQRLVDRVERELERERGESARLREAQSRLVLALGALQRENALLAGRLAALGAGAGPGGGASGTRPGRAPRWAFWRRRPRA